MKCLVLAASFILAFICPAAAQPAMCPKIEITGPSGLTKPGDKVVFTVNVPGAESTKLKYNWYLSAGSIEGGLGTPTIAFRTKPYDASSNITATIEIEGLPAGCPNTASETAGVSCGGGTPETIEEYGRITLREEKSRLRSLIAKSRQMERGHRIVFVFYRQGAAGKTSVRNREAALSRYLVRLGVSRERFSFVNSENKPYWTKIYFVPEKC